MLYSPEAHEPIAGEPWSDDATAAIAALVAEAEDAFDDGGRRPAGRRRAARGDDPLQDVYLGGAGVVDALQRLEGADSSTCGGDYVAYLERSLDAPPDFPDQDAERSLWRARPGSGSSCSGSRPRWRTWSAWRS